jgi:hypothetical protein
MFLLKIPAYLIGLALTIAGGIALIVGIPWLVVAVILLLGADADAGKSLGGAVLCSGGGLIAVYLGSQLGRFVRGDFD